MSCVSSSGQKQFASLWHKLLPPTILEPSFPIKKFFYLISLLSPKDPLPSGYGYVEKGHHGLRPHVL